MQCLARWKEDNEAGACFRDHTILQFGDSWELLASFVLLNPGSATPIGRESYNAFLESMSLSYFVNEDGGHCFRFSVDRLMNDLMKLYSRKYAGGVLKLYNCLILRIGIQAVQSNSSKPIVVTHLCLPHQKT
jgi:hypothetical protein